MLTMFVCHIVACSGNVNKQLKSTKQGLAKVALIGSKPPPQIKKERVAGLARERQTGNTLFYSFLGRGGESDQLKS